ncbi:MAG: substrate-binding domain-containing protein [Rhodocyclaceae bacterium]|nr:substrate-binding domain-containing protein [Rhodocyclaceae bacterium]
MRQLAEQLGLSQTTVSRALNGFPEVSETTRVRVVEAARRLDYRPSASAASLATGRTSVIGNVVTLDDGVVIDPHLSEFQAGVGEGCARYGYDLLTRVSTRDGEAAAYRDLASRGKVDGMVLHGPLVDEPRIEMLRALGLPFVVHGRGGGDSHHYTWLDVDNQSAFGRATEFLLGLGHRRIALLNGLEVFHFAACRLRGYRAALGAAGIEVDPQLIFSDQLLEPYGYRRMRDMLMLSNAPTAILCASVLTALGVARGLHEAGLQPGRDVSVVAFDDDLSFLHPSSRCEVPYFTCMRSSIRAAGRRVAQLLIEAIMRPDAPPPSELWESEMVVGRSTGPFRPLPRRGDGQRG